MAPRGLQRSHLTPLLGILALLVPLTGFQRPVLQQPMSLAGFVEPHTPGSGDPRELPLSPALTDLLGPAADLNRVPYVRTAMAPPGRRGRGPRPRVVLILVPGFSVGARTLDPLARDLVTALGGRLEVWAVDRRPNQLEDRLGAQHALAGAERGQPRRLVEGAQFYFADVDEPPLGNFPGAEDLDLDEDGRLDPQRPLVDRFGVTRTARLLVQDDARFLAWWGVDTHVRDWRRLVDRARARVGKHGLVLLGGHSQGTTWATLFAAYDFDPGPGVDAGHRHVDGLLLLEGNGIQSDGGFGFPDLPAPPADAQGYRDRVRALAASGGPDVFLGDLSLAGVPLLPIPQFGAAGELTAIAARFAPSEPALIQRTPVFRAGALALFYAVPATNRGFAGLLLDDDFQPFTAFRVSMGFSDDGPNTRISLPLPDLDELLDTFYAAGPAFGGGQRTWKEFDDPTLPSCPPNRPDQGVGCAVLDNGPPSAAGEPPRENGREREVTALDTLLGTQFGFENGFEWYFASGRTNLDVSLGNDSSLLGDDRLLAVTQNASVDVPVLAIGGSNGMTPEPKSFADYLDSIATPPHEREVVILEGYAHADVVMAERNEAVPVIADWIERQAKRKARRHRLQR